MLFMMFVIFIQALVIHSINEDYHKIVDISNQCDSNYSRCSAILDQCMHYGNKELNLHCKNTGKQVMCE